MPELERCPSCRQGTLSVAYKTAGGIITEAPKQKEVPNSKVQVCPRCWFDKLIVAPQPDQPAQN